MISHIDSEDSNGFIQNSRNNDLEIFIDFSSEVYGATSTVQKESCASYPPSSEVEEQRPVDVMYQVMA